MKRNSLLTFCAKVMLLGGFVVLEPTGAFAQITLDLGVLSDDPVTEKTTTSVPVKKSEPAKPAAKPQPAKPAAKPVVKSAAKPAVKKAQKKETVQVKEKYQVKETKPKDAHDRLKPHRAPVPDVKVLASSKDGISEEDDIPVEASGRKESSSFKEPKLSKHFLKQQRRNEQQTLTENENVRPTEGIRKEDEPEKPHVVTPQQLKKEAAESAGTEKTVIVNAPKPAIEKTLTVPVVKQTEATVQKTPEVPAVKQAEKAPEKTVPTFSVFPVDESLTLTERSAKLTKEIPADSGTVKVLSEKKTLYDILRFEPKTLELTPEMQTALDRIAALLKKDRKKRLLIYSYGAVDPLEPGKERQYALRRALMVRSYLIVQGIHSLRIELRSQGSKGAGDTIPDRTDLVLQDR